MEGSLKDNGKVSDSGCTNTCISQSQRSSGSSLSKNSKRSESSGYCGGHTSVFDTSNYALPQPISKRKSKQYEEKKSKNTTSPTSLGDGVGTKFESQIKSGEQNDVGTYDTNGSSSDFTSNCNKKEIAGRELIGDTTLERHNGSSNSTESEGRIGTITNPLEDTSSNTNAEFSVVISMKNGHVVDTTSSLKSLLGYTRESWVDRSFIDFVDPKDKQTFVNHLAKNMAPPFVDYDTGMSGRHRSMFCSLRKNDGGKSSAESASDENSSPAAKTMMYLPFHLTTSIKVFRDRNNADKPRMTFLIVNAEPIVPVYKAPEAMIISTTFLIQHDPSCIVTHVDANVVQYLGYMPHDMIGHSIFEFYHPEDLPFLKDVYETVVRTEGSPFRSKPYRFAVQNGDYVVLETEWSAFVNPWREKIEFTVGHHRVLRGPTNPNVFQPPTVNHGNLVVNISEEVFKESKIIQGEIRALLDEKIQRTESIEACKVTSTYRDLQTFVKNSLRDDKLPEPVSKERVTTDGRSILEHDSVILGAISPHHQGCDSKSSSETPPSYNQLNYNEKIARFFDSKLLITAAYGSDEDNVNCNVPSNEFGGKTSSGFTGTKDGILSGENLSSDSNNRTTYDSRDDNDNARSVNTMLTEDLKILPLTESVLNKHNQEMEKLLVQQHKKRLSTIKDKKKQNQNFKLTDTKDVPNKYGKDETKIRGAKRTSNDDIRERQHCKVSKYDESLHTYQPIATSTPTNLNDTSSRAEQPRQNTNMWSHSAVTVPPQPPHPYLRVTAQNNENQQTSVYPGLSPFVPIYYALLPRIRNDFVQPILPPISNPLLQNGQTQQSTYVSYNPGPLAGVIYPPAVSASAPVTTIYTPFVIPATAPIHRENLHSYSSAARQENSSDCPKRPASQATSIRAEPGSFMALSESSKKPFSLGEYVSSCVSIDGGCSSLVPNAKRETNANSQLNSSLEDSSDSSFYGSFLTTSNGSNRDTKSKIVAHPPQSPLRNPISIENQNKEKKQLNMLRIGSPWQEGVKMTPELIYQYQLAPKPLNELLEADMKALKTFNQPEMVNDQLAQLYSDMELGTADLAEKLLHCERDASTDSESGSSGDDPRIIIPEKNVRSHLNWMRRRQYHPRLNKTKIQ